MLFDKNVIVCGIQKIYIKNNSKYYFFIIFIADTTIFKKKNCLLALFSK